FVPVTQGPLDINTIAGMTWVFGTHLYPIVFLIMGAAFRTMDPALEEAAALSGAGIWARPRPVALAVSRPAILSALLIVFVRARARLRDDHRQGLPPPAASARSRAPRHRARLWCLLLRDARAPATLGLLAVALPVRSPVLARRHPARFVRAVRVRSELQRDGR